MSMGTEAQVLIGGLSEPAPPVQLGPPPRRRPRRSEAEAVSATPFNSQGTRVGGPQNAPLHQNAGR
jgi:hypothetical protein